MKSHKAPKREHHDVKTRKDHYDLLPPLHNTRADSIWTHISKAVDFTDKTVLDMGCGRGDIAMRAWCAGAERVFGIDKNKIEISDAKIRSGRLMIARAHIHFLPKDIDEIDDKWPGHHDIVICTSVLPYLDDPDKALRYMCDYSDAAIIECQYKGDGPGFENIKNDKDMRDWLDKFDWKEIDKIGSTKLESRDASRSIWKCNND
jgi:SAM-dependent methyltransferase